MAPLDEIMAFANANRVAYMATAVGNQPRVHAFDMWRADRTGFYFHNNATEGVYNQIINNPEVELLFRSPNGRQGLRVVGTARLVNDAALADAYYRSSNDRNLLRSRGKPTMVGNDAMFVVTGAAWLRQQDKGKHGKWAGEPVIEANFPAP